MPGCIRGNARRPAVAALRNRAARPPPLRIRADSAVCDLAIGLDALGGMSEQHVRQFVQPRLVRQRTDGIDRDRTGAREPQDVAVRRVEWDLGHVQRHQRASSVPRRNRHRWDLGALSLRQHEPVRPVDEPGIDARLVRLVVTVSRPCDRDRLTQCDRLLALADVPPEFLPAWKRRHRSGLHAAL